MGALLKNIAVWNGTGVSAIILDGSGSEYNFDEHKHKFDFEITYYWMPIGYQKRLLSGLSYKRNIYLNEKYLLYNQSFKNIKDVKVFGIENYLKYLNN